MATSFSTHERNIIKEKLYEAARQYAAIVGIRKTTVDQLVEAADISKGMFYKLYASKEMLFFEMLEDMHAKAYSAADAALKSSAGQADSVRISKAVSAACEILDTSGMMEIMEKDTSYLLRKLPREIADSRYHEISVHIRDLLENNDIVPVCGTEIATDIIRSIFLMILHKTEIGENYETVMKYLIEGISNQLFQ